jgi:hypothetical protein
MIDIRMFELTKDYPPFQSWHPQGMMAPPMQILPAVGSMVEIDGKPAAAGFLYLATDSPCSVIEWIMANPEMKPRDRHSAISHVLSSLKEAAIAENHPVVFLHSIGGVAKVAARSGFVVMSREICKSALNLGE